MKRIYDDDGFEFERLNLLGAAYRGLSDVGEVLVTVDEIPNADKDAWVARFGALGDRTRAHADDCLAKGHRESARSAYLRACTYFQTASANAPGTKDPDAFGRRWHDHRDCWDR